MEKRWALGASILFPGVPRGSPHSLARLWHGRSSGFSRRRAGDHRFRSSIYARVGRGSPREPVPHAAAVCCRRPGSLMSAVDVSGTGRASGRPPTAPRASRPSATRHADWYTSRVSGRSAGHRHPARPGRSRRTSWAGCTRDRLGHRRSCRAP